MRASLPATGVRRAIVIDDSRAMRSMLRNALEQSGFEVIEAADGKEALIKLMSSEPLELALVDWNMPELNGLTLIRFLRSNPKYDRMAIVMVTSETETTQIQRALSAGADEYIMKPLSADVLMEKLRLLEEAEPSR
jgi:two-component system, chemotaxis family, chemotaxis protein CheY